VFVSSLLQSVQESQKVLNQIAGDVFYIASYSNLTDAASDIAD